MIKETLRDWTVSISSETEGSSVGVNVKDEDVEVGILVDASKE